MLRPWTVLCRARPDVNEWTRTRRYATGSSANFGGKVVELERQERWRAAWFAKVSCEGSVRPYYVRGSRGGRFRELITLEQEADVNRVLRANGVPVPKVYGMIDDPPAIVMECLPGRVNLATAEDEAEREAVIDQYVESMRRMHAIDVTRNSKR